MGFNVDKFIAKVEAFVNNNEDRQGKTDGKLDDVEKASIFNNPDLANELTSAIKKGELNEIDASNIFGLSKSEYAKYNSATSKTSIEMMQDDVLDRVLKGGSSYFFKDNNGVAEIADNVDFDTLVEDLKNRLIGENVQSVNKEYYTQLIEQLTSVSNAVKQAIENAKQGRTDGQAYDSRKDVLNLYNTLKKELKFDKNDEFAAFKSAVLDNLMFIVEKHQISKEEKRLNDKYGELRKTMTREQAVKTLRKSEEFKGSYYESYSNQFGSIGKSNSHKGLLKDMENGIVLEDARQEVMEAIWAQRGTGITESGDIETAAKKTLGDHNDKYTAKIFRGELSFAEKVKWERSTIKDFRKAVAAYNRVEANKKREYSEKEMTDAVKDNKVFTQLVSDGQLITRNENGTYNISNLSDLIRDAISHADYRANYQTKDNSTLGEIESVMRAIKIKTDVDISRGDAKRLIDFCGFDRDKKNIFKTIYNGTVGGLAGTLASLTTALTVGLTQGGFSIDTTNLNSKLQDTTFPIRITSENHTQLNINIATKTIVDGVEVAGKTNVNAFEIIRSLSQQGFGPGEAGFEMLEDGTYRLWVDKSSTAFIESQGRLGDILPDLDIKPEDIDAKQDDAKIDRSRGFFFGLMVAMGLSILNEALKELPGETAVLTTDFQAKNLEEYEKELTKEKNLPAQARNGIKQIAEYYYKKDGNLDGYHEFLRSAAGGSSVLNKKELIFAVYMKLQEIKNGLIEEPKPKQEPKPEPIPVPEPKPEPKPVTKDWEATSKDKLIPQTKFRAWQDVVNGYTCFDRPEFKKSYKSGTDASGKPIYVSVANRMVKVMQAMDISKVESPDALKTFYNVEYIKAFAEDTLKFGFKKAKEMHPDFPINEEEFNAVLKSTAGVKGNVYTPVLYDPASAAENGDDGLCGYNDPKTKTPITYGNGGTAYTVVTKDGVTEYFKREVGTTKWQSCNKTEYDLIPKKVPY